LNEPPFFLLVALPARYEKLSLYDLFLLVVNMVAAVDGTDTKRTDTLVTKVNSQKVSEKVAEEAAFYTALAGYSPQAATRRSEEKSLPEGDLQAYICSSRCMHRPDNHSAFTADRNYEQR
jgi:hypothetical protein